MAKYVLIVFAILLGAGALAAHLTYPGGLTALLRLSGPRGGKGAQPM